MAKQDRYYVEDPRFSTPVSQTPLAYPERLEEEPQRRRRGCLAGCALGCFGGGVVLLLVAAGAVYWLITHWRDIASNVGAQALKQSIEATDLPAAEKVQMAVQIDRVAAGFREGRINERQMQAIFQNLVESPLLTFLAASAIESKYIAPSGLGDAEKAEARHTLRRYLRGSIDGKIDEEQVNAVMAHVADEQEDGSWRLRDRVADDDLREFLNATKAQADAANIPAEPEDVDPSDEFKRIIDDALGVADEEPLAEAPL